MYTKWTEHLKTDVDKENFKRAVHNSKPVLERLTKILQSFEDDIDRSEISTKSFENPNWAYLQAFKNGGRAQLHSMKTLINLDQQKDN